MAKQISNLLKFLSIALVIIFSIQIINKILGNLVLILGAVLVSLGILAIIWTLLARYNLSPKSQLRFFADNFLGCSIAILLFTILLTIEQLALIKYSIYIKYFLISAVYFFLILASFYIYAIGRAFGFQKKSIEIKQHLKEIRRNSSISKKKPNLQKP